MQVNLNLNQAREEIDACDPVSQSKLEALQIKEEQEEEENKEDRKLERRRRTSVMDIYGHGF